MKTHLGDVQSCYDRGHVKLIISPFALLFSTAYSLYQILIVILIFFRNPPPLLLQNRESEFFNFRLCHFFFFY